ncbi:Glycopeptide antibiotics resistance protein [Ruminococcaceae bacterium YRB3002]|nr:Glycopeptide antibiotics resistance protein [Ruminococcaceae bacterium YRB3002]
MSGDKESMITDRGRPLRVLLVILFIVYLLLVPVWVLLLKSSCEIFYISRWQGQIFADAEMFANFTHYSNMDPTNIFWGDMILNVAAFVPFGIYLEMLFHEKPFLLKTLTMFCVSLAIEITQFVLMIGATDIVDLIANTLGGVTGLIVMRVLYHNNMIKIVLVLAILMTLIVGIEVGIHSVNIYYDIRDFYNEENYNGYLNDFQEEAELVPQMGAFSGSQ